MLLKNLENTTVMKNIICFETEWLYNHQDKQNRFNLNTQPILQWLKEFYNIEVIYRKILTRNDIGYYMDYFNDRRRFKNYQIIYIAAHGTSQSIYLEGEEDPLKLSELAQIVPGFFEDRIVHFSSCTTMRNFEAVSEFKKQTHALRVSGYCKKVDAMDSAILDMAYLNALQNFKVKTIEKEASKFQQHYASLIDYLQFQIV